ncbi:glycosyltransferase family 25 protein [Idiomarina seosinensis]|uniref:Glycosyl transferase n=1 Tax=Idiomarina seosinensis TaxID=281739 RepID=A0A432ZCY3_9GAMM|nr:glycosyltransferase family 25 protein [Idiomarina seosinensis]RUO75808.1 glycosyl transferase [Idiomarina seosinensis]
MHSDVPILLINLDRSKQRLQSATEQLNQWRLPFTRISAVDGKSLDENTVKRVFDEDNARCRYPYDLTIGEIGCYLSHVKCWQYIVDHKLDFAVILEDDLCLNADTPKVLDQLRKITTEWDYIKLASPYKFRPYHIVEQLTQSNPTISLVRYRQKIPSGTVAQVISYRGAQRLLQQRPPFFRPIDVDIQWQHELTLDTFGLLPYIADNADAPSEIQQLATRKALKQRRWVKLKELLRFKLKI